MSAEGGKSVLYVQNYPNFNQVVYTFDSNVAKCQNSSSTFFFQNFNKHAAFKFSSNGHNLDGSRPNLDGSLSQRER